MLGSVYGWLSRGFLLVQTENQIPAFFTQKAIFIKKNTELRNLCAEQITSDHHFLVTILLHLLSELQELQIFNYCTSAHSGLNSAPSANFPTESRGAEAGHVFTLPKIKHTRKQVFDHLPILPSCHSTPENMKHFSLREFLHSQLFITILQHCTCLVRAETPF